MAKNPTKKAAPKSKAKASVKASVKSKAKTPAKAKAKVAPSPKPAPKTKAKIKAVVKAPAKAQKSAAKPAAPVKKMTQEKPTLSKEQRIKSVLKKLAGGLNKSTPALFKLPARHNTPVAFSLNEIRDLIKEKAKKGDTHAPVVAKKGTGPKVVEHLPAAAPRVLKSATLDDLLGGSAAKRESLYVEHDESKVPAKFLPYFKKLKSLRDHFIGSVGDRSAQTLGASAKESSGDLSNYGQHLGNAGTDVADYDFALSMVSSEQEVLREVELALDRIFDGSYGVCEVTGKPISRDRLNAVPFTRFSKEGQDQYEKTVRKTSQRVGISSSEDDDGAYSDEEQPEEN